jgi:hypothetical protein
MRKYLIGIIIGIALSLTATTYAEDIKSMIGQKIQGEFPVKINGTELEKHAIVIDGTSYLPNRAIADALDMDIKFDADLGIELNKKENPTIMEPQQETILTPSQSSNPGYELEKTNGSIKGFNQLLSGLELQLKALENGGNGDSEKADSYRIKIKNIKVSIAELESQKAALETSPTPTP